RPSRGSPTESSPSIRTKRGLLLLLIDPTPQRSSLCESDKPLNTFWLPPRNPHWRLCISSSALGCGIGLGFSPGCPARVSGWRVSVTTCVCAEARHESRRLAADAIRQEEASAPFIATHASNWNRRTCSDEQGHWRPPSSLPPLRRFVRRVAAGAAHQRQSFEKLLAVHSGQP